MTIRKGTPDVIETNALAVMGKQDNVVVRKGRVEGYGRKAEVVWCLVARALKNMGYE